MMMAELPGTSNRFVAVVGPIKVSAHASLRETPRNRAMIWMGFIPETLLLTLGVSMCLKKGPRDHGTTRPRSCKADLAEGEPGPTLLDTFLHWK
jgi:hypothetical protein